MSALQPHKRSSETPANKDDRAYKIKLQPHKRSSETVQSSERAGDDPRFNRTSVRLKQLSFRPSDLPTVASTAQAFV